MKYKYYDIVSSNGSLYVVDEKTDNIKSEDCRYCYKDKTVWSAGNLCENCVKVIASNDRDLTVPKLPTPEKKRKNYTKTDVETAIKMARIPGDNYMTSDRIIQSLNFAIPKGVKLEMTRTPLEEDPDNDRFFIGGGDLIPVVNEKTVVAKEWIY